MEFPMRINKYLAWKNIASRREADELIKKGKIRINGRRAVLGDKVNENDEVKVAPGKIKDYIYLAFNKPRDIMTHSPQNSDRGINDILKFKEKVYPVGRLDKSSHGLIILTNDGRITDKVLSPERGHEKEYSVKVNRNISEGFIRHMSEGVVLDDGYKTKKAFVQKKEQTVFSIILTEGKNRQIRRMCTALGYEVIDLKRTRIMNIALGDLKVGAFRKIEGKELAMFLGKLGMQVEA